VTGHAEQVVKQLAWLDRQPDIVRFLRAIGVRGTRRDKEHCPIAEYLRPSVPDARLEVGRLGVWVDSVDGAFGTAVPFTRRLAHFTSAFNNGAYPFLRKVTR